MSNRNLSPTDGPSTDCEPTGGPQIRLAEHLGTRIEQRLPGTEFDSVEEYVTFVMESVLREIDEEPADGDDAPETSDREYDDTDTDTDTMEDRLESLGYL